MRPTGPVAASTCVPSSRARRPANRSSRSSHEFSSGPPYTSTPACTQPSAVTVAGFGLSLNPGESVCAPSTRNTGTTPALCPASSGPAARASAPSWRPIARAPIGTIQATAAPSRTTT